MSYQAIAFIRKHTCKLSSSARHVYRVLCDFHNASTGQCNPSLNTLAAATGLNRKTVLRARKELEAVGEIGVESGSFGRPNCYTLLAFERSLAVAAAATGPESAGAQEAQIRDRAQKRDRAQNVPDNRPNFTHVTGPISDPESFRESINDQERGQTASASPQPLSPQNDLSQVKGQVKGKVKTQPYDPFTEVLPDWLNTKAFGEWVDHRASIRKPIACRAQALKIADQFRDLDQQQQQAMVDYSITGGYPQVYPDRVSGNVDGQNFRSSRKEPFSPGQFLRDRWTARGYSLEDVYNWKGRTFAGRPTA